jgi:CIC family chloride channel protein
MTGWQKQIPELGEGATFLRKWGLIGVLIGAGAGIGALALTWLITIISHFLLSGVVGYTPPLPGGEGGADQYFFHLSRPWLLPLVTAGAGLVGGLLTWKFAPQTAGIGTNAAIQAFHHSEKLNLARPFSSSSPPRLRSAVE